MVSTRCDETLASPWLLLLYCKVLICVRYNICLSVCTTGNNTLATIPNRNIHIHSSSHDKVSQIPRWKMATSRLLHHPSSIPSHPIPSHATNPTKKRPTKFTCNVITHARNNSWMGWVKEGLSDRRKMLFLPPFFFSLPFFWHAK